MKAPDRITLSKYNITKDGNVVFAWLTNSPDCEPMNYPVEYVRADAFIEKACDAYCAICDTKECGGCAECTWVIKFRRQLLKY